MNKQERLTEIENTFFSLKSALSRFSEEELNTVPFEGSWTVGQVAGHIIKSIGGIPDEKTEPAIRPFEEKIAPIREMFLNMQMKFKADPSLEPEQSHYQLKYLLKPLEELESLLTNAVLNKNMKYLCLDMELPGFGYLTRYEWIRFMMVHTQRHILQIEEIYQKLHHEV